ncbi:MAG: DUF4832 domain-containing protein [Chitinophagaceae bacterium]
MVIENISRKLLIGSVTICSLLSQGKTFAQEKRHVYKESKEEIVNPERGFYIPRETKASRFVALDATELATYRTVPRKTANAKYAVQVSLVYRSYELDIFKQQPLADSFLLKLQQDFDAVRTAGLKMILRFAYTNSAKSGDCRDAYKICPPYGDAPFSIVLGHIAQLKPVLQKNAALIAVLQEGFIGIWGENYFTDYLGDASTNGPGYIPDSSWQQRNAILKALLEALPANRMVQVRTPQIKQKFVYGPAAPVNSLPLPLTDAYSAAEKARIGFHNDCFLSSADDYGTFYDYGSSTQSRGPANEILRRYIEADTRFTAVGGETCDDTFSPQNDCAPAGYAEREMAAMHYSYLNASYNNDVNNDWDSSGCLPAIRRNLGYRFVLQQAVLPVTATLNGKIKLQFTVSNTGYASPYNPRPVKLMLRNLATQKEFSIQLQTNPQFWFSGINKIAEACQLPGNLPKGRYELFLQLPDEDISLASRPVYSIRFANSGIWEPMSGYHNLWQVFTVR